MIVVIPSEAVAYTGVKILSTMEFSQSTYATYLTAYMKDEKLTAKQMALAGLPPGIEDA